MFGGGFLRGLVADFSEVSLACWLTGRLAGLSGRLTGRVVACLVGVTLLSDLWEVEPGLKTRLLCRLNVRAVWENGDMLAWKYPRDLAL